MIVKRDVDVKFDQVHASPGVHLMKHIETRKLMKIMGLNNEQV